MVYTLEPCPFAVLKFTGVSFLLTGMLNVALVAQPSFSQLIKFVIIAASIL